MHKGLHPATYVYRCDMYDKPCGAGAHLCPTKLCYASCVRLQELYIAPFHLPPYYFIKTTNLVHEVKILNKYIVYQVYMETTAFVNYRDHMIAMILHHT